MAGLNYGNSYKLNRSTKNQRVAGVAYSTKSNKWVVRINRNGHCISIAQFDTEDKANECFKQY